MMIFRPAYSVCLIIPLLFSVGLLAQDTSWKKGRLIYENALTEKDSLGEWVMEGPGKIKISDGWMEMHAPHEQWHHVYWCPVNFPSRFAAEWEVKNLNPQGGLLIVFFAAKGADGEDIFDPSLPARDGTFRQYTKERIKSYHVSYYTNNPRNPDRELAHLRKNNTFALVQTGPEGIPKNSLDVHKISLIKNGAHILFYIDGRKIIDWTDDGNALGPVLADGKIGFRQMQWSRFAYRNFKVWALE